MAAAFGNKNLALEQIFFSDRRLTSWISHGCLRRSSSRHGHLAFGGRQESDAQMLRVRCMPEQDPWHH